MMKILLRILFCLILFLSSFDSVCAADYYVNLSSASNGSGTSGSPWNNLDSARASQGPVTAGDTVYVWGDGNGYNRSVAFTSGDKGSSGSPITYTQRVGYAQAIIDGNGFSGVGVSFGNDADFITLYGLEITNWDTAGVSFTAASSTSADDVIIQACNIHDNPGQSGVHTGSGQISNFQLLDNTIANNSDSNYFGHGVYISDCAGGCVVSGNDIYGSYANGLQIQSRIVDGLSVNGIIVEKNDIHENGLLSSSSYGYGVRIAEWQGTANQTQNVTLRNNRIWGNDRAGVHWESQMTNNVEYNDSLYANDQGGIVTTSPSSALIVRNCAAWGNTTTQIDTTSITQSNNYTSTNPWLSVDDTNPNFLKIDSGSPCYNTGYSLPSVDEDRFGTARPQDTYWDIGAHEWSSGAVANAIFGGNGAVNVSNTAP